MTRRASYPAQPGLVCTLNLRVSMATKPREECGDIATRTLIMRPHCIGILTMGTVQLSIRYPVLRSRIPVLPPSLSALHPQCACDTSMARLLAAASPHTSTLLCEGIAQ